MDHYAALPRKERRQNQSKWGLRPQTAQSNQAWHGQPWSPPKTDDRKSADMLRVHVEPVAAANPDTNCNPCDPNAKGNPCNNVCDESEMQRLNGRVQELAEQRRQRQCEAEEAQKRLKCVEWEHSMSEAAAEWYRLRCEEQRAGQVAQEAQAKWNAAKCELQKAAQIAQTIHGQKP